MGRRSFNIDLICTVKNEFSNIKSLISDLNKQTEVPNRIVIVDGGSNDGTWEILEKYKKKGVDKIISKKDPNMWAAMNRGIKISRGEIICMLNSDDFFTQNALNIVAKYFKDNDIDYFFGAVKKIIVCAKF